MSSETVPRVASREDLQLDGSLARISPDGRRVAYCSDDGVATRLWVSAGGPPACVARLGDAVVHELAWSPSGDHLAYVTGRDPAFGTERYVGWAAAGGSEELGRVPGLSFCWGVAKPSLAVADVRQRALCHVDVATGTSKVLAELLDDGHLAHPPHIAIPSDGRHIAFCTRSSYRDLSEVWLVRRSKAEGQSHGLASELLTQIPGAGVQVRLLWSPKGKSLGMFIAHPTIAQTALIVLQGLQGDGEVLHHHDALDPAICPAWSPDGRWIALFCCASGTTQLSLLDVKGRTIHALADDVPPAPLHFVANDRLAAGGVLLGLR